MVVDDLLDAGADPFVQDSQGNTGLHYLASIGLAEVLQGEKTRHLFRRFLKRGVDINVRNKSHRSALEIFVDDSGERRNVRSSEYRYVVEELEQGKHLQSPEDVDKEVFNYFENARQSWTEVDGEGRTPLHIVAKYPYNLRGPAWAKILLSKGIKPWIKDKRGQTAIDIAKASENLNVHGILRQAMRLPIDVFGEHAAPG